MHNSAMNAIHPDNSHSRTDAIRNAALGCAALAALLSASCCIIPIALTVAGLGGAWLSFLSPFAAHRELILTLVSLIVAYQWLRVLTRKSTTRRGRRNIAMVAVTSLATVLAWTAPLWEWDVSGMMLDAWATYQ